MENITITDVREGMGDTGFLIDDGTTAVLVDTGYGFTGKAMARNIKKYLGDRRLDYILLTHSHYDHVLGVPHVLKQYPRAKVVAGTYASSIFQRPSALKLMYEMDCKAAGYMGVAPSEDLTDTGDKAGDKNAQLFMSELNEINDKLEKLIRILSFSCMKKPNVKNGNPINKKFL